ncbi:MAG: phosphatase PAP2 family protein [Synechococcaceae cyanobacterium ELA263]
MRTLPLVISALALLPLTGGGASASLAAIGPESARAAGSGEASKVVGAPSAGANGWQASALSPDPAPVKDPNTSPAIALTSGSSTVTDEVNPSRAAAAPVASPAAGLQLDMEALAKITGQPPPPESAAARDDLAVLNWLQRHRTPQMVATTWTTLGRDGGLFSPALGVDMSKSTPRVDQGLGVFLALVDQACNRIKDIVRRPRPYWSHAHLKPCLPPERGFSFPSGHSSWYQTAAELLADLLPERRERLLTIGSYGGANRVMCGVHYPSDVDAAQRLGRAAAEQIIASPQWQRFRADPGIAAELQRVRDAQPEALPLLVR